MFRFLVLIIVSTRFCEYTMMRLLGMISNDIILSARPNVIQQLSGLSSFFFFFFFRRGIIALSHMKLDV